VGGGVVEQNDDRSTEVSATGRCPTKPAHGDAALRANRHSPAVEASAFPPEGDGIALFMQMPIIGCYEKLQGEIPRSARNDSVVAPFPVGVKEKAPT